MGEGGGGGTSETELVKVEICRNSHSSHMDERSIQAENLLQTTAG